jgi:predicted ArsR family transcriptional regulator
VETLKLVAKFPDGAIASDVAHEFGISIRAAEGRLQRLEEAGCLGLRFAFPNSTVSFMVHVLLPKGRDAITEEGDS